MKTQRCWNLSALLTFVILLLLALYLISTSNRQYDVENRQRERAIKSIREALIPPSQEGTYFLDEGNKTYYSQHGQDMYVANRIGRGTNGTFIEAGALDGERFSNTLYFEKTLGWTGLLVEPNPVMFKKLQEKHRRAWLLNGCLGSDPNKLEMITLHYGDDHAQSYLADNDRIYRRNYRKAAPNATTVRCYPLELILSVLGWTHIDYFSLDVEGTEDRVLLSVPFRKVSFGVISVECDRCADRSGKSPGNDEVARENRYFMKKLLGIHGYNEIHYIDQIDIFYGRK